MWKDSIRNIVVIFQPNILRIVGFYVRHSAIIWSLAKDHDLPEFWPYGRLKGPKIENETSRNIVLSSFFPWTKITGRHEQVFYLWQILQYILTE